MSLITGEYQPEGEARLIRRYVGVEMAVPHRDLVRPHPGVGAVDALTIFRFEAPAVIWAHEASPPIDDLPSVVGANVGQQLVPLLSTH